MVKFTKKKFLSLPLQRQQRHLAKLVRECYTNGGDESYRLYQELLSFIRAKQPATQLDDCYHIHLQQADRRLKEHGLLPTKHQTDRDTPLAPPLPISIYLDNLRSAHNVGSIVRTVEAFGLGPIIAGGTTPAPSAKTAMGCEEWVDFTHGSLDEVPRPIIAVELAEGATPYHDFTFPETFTLALGNEERGCSKELLENADEVIYIPMRGRKNSLNVANAFSVVAAKIVQSQN